MTGLETLAAVALTSVICGAINHRGRQRARRPSPPRRLVRAEATGRRRFDRAAAHALDRARAGLAAEVGAPVVGHVVVTSEGQT